MANYYAQATLANKSGETADVHSNIFAFTGPDVFTPTEGNFVGTAIEAFYNGVNGLNPALCGLAQNGHTIKIYSAVTTPPNYPIDVHNFGLTNNPPDLDLPAEVSLCVSYANDSATIVPRARRRGRIYLGGFLEADNTAGRPSVGAIEALVDSYEVYVDALAADPEFAACIWSRTNASLYPIERIWADNEWDTQRSRGGKSTSRYEIVVS